MNETQTALPLGITHNAYGRFGETESLRRMAEHGYRVLDYQNFVNIESDFFCQEPSAFAASLREERAHLADFGFRVGQAHAPWRWPASDVGPAWTDAMKKSIVGCTVLECPLFVVHPLMPHLDSAEDAEGVLALNRAFFADLCDFARPLGVTVLIENMPWKSGYPLATVGQVCDFAVSLGRENLGICFDTGHAALFYGRDIAAGVRLAGGLIRALHLHDNGGDHDRHLRLGEGIIDWHAFALALREIGFTGTVSLETSPHADDPATWEEEALSLAAAARAVATTAMSGD